MLIDIYLRYRCKRGEYASIRLSRKNGHHLLTFSVCSISISTTAVIGLSSAQNRNSPCDPVTKLCPQNFIPFVRPDESDSYPHRLTHITGNPFATACLTLNRSPCIELSCLFFRYVCTFPSYSCWIN